MCVRASRSGACSVWRHKACAHTPTSNSITYHFSYVRVPTLQCPTISWIPLFLCFTWCFNPKRVTIHVFKNVIIPTQLVGLDKYNVKIQYFIFFQVPSNHSITQILVWFLLLTAHNNRRCLLQAKKQKPWEIKSNVPWNKHIYFILLNIATTKMSSLHPTGWSKLCIKQ